MEELHCPECGSIVYSRLNPICGVCGKALPDSFRFEEAQAAILEGELEHARRDLQAVSEDKATQDEGFTPPDSLFLEDATDKME